MLFQDHGYVPAVPLHSALVRQKLPSSFYPHDVHQTRSPRGGAPTAELLQSQAPCPRTMWHPPRSNQVQLSGFPITGGDLSHLWPQTLHMWRVCYLRSKLSESKWVAPHFVHPKEASCNPFDKLSTAAFTHSSKLTCFATTASHSRTLRATDASARLNFPYARPSVPSTCYP